MQSRSMESPSTCAAQCERGATGHALRLRRLVTTDVIRRDFRVTGSYWRVPYFPSGSWLGPLSFGAAAAARRPARASFFVGQRARSRLSLCHEAELPSLSWR